MLDTRFHKHKSQLQRISQTFIRLVGTLHPVNFLVYHTTRTKTFIVLAMHSKRSAFRKPITGRSRYAVSGVNLIQSVRLT